jgi:hypothetical protein
MWGLHQNPNSSLCDTLDGEGRRIWIELASSYNSGIGRKEETITDDLLVRVHAAHPYEVLTFPFRKHDEAKTGADWEWWLTDGALWFGLLIQAKKLDPASHKYHGIKHVVRSSNTPQIDLLMTQAGLKGIDPLYFFYNYSTSPLASFQWNCGVVPKEIEQFGCTVAHARGVKYLLRQGGAGLPKLSRISVPMKCLVCCSCIASSNAGLPSRGEAVVGALCSGYAEVFEAAPIDHHRPRENPPSYVQQLFDTSPDERGVVIEQLRTEVGPIGSLVIILEKQSD